eukprot:1725164-Amphidinium_carterae.2
MMCQWSLRTGENLGPVCGPEHKEECSEEEKTLLEVVNVLVSHRAQEMFRSKLDTQSGRVFAAQFWMGVWWG